MCDRPVYRLDVVVKGEIDPERLRELLDRWVTKSGV